MEEEIGRGRDNLIERMSARMANMPESDLTPSLRSDADIAEIAVRRMRKIGIPMMFIGASLGQFPDGVAVRAAQGIETRGLFLTGPRGTGKTHFAAAIVRHVIELDIRLDKQVPAHRWEDRPPITTVLWTTVPDLLIEIRGTYGRSEHDTERDLVRRYARVGLLVLDDLGAENATDWADSMLFVILNHRYTEARRTVVTSNLSLDEIDAKVGDRVASRIAGMCELLEFRGKDRRLRRPVEGRG